MFSSRVLFNKGAASAAKQKSPRWWQVWKPSAAHRTAREVPLFINIKLMVVSIAVGGVAFKAFQTGRQTVIEYYANKGDVYTHRKIREHLSDHPDQAAALVMTVLHYVLLNPSTPFGDPLIIPAEIKKEIEAIEKRLLEISEEQNLPGHVDMPDLWVISVRSALLSLGGSVPDAMYGGRKLSTTAASSSGSSAGSEEAAAAAAVTAPHTYHQVCCDPLAYSYTEHDVLKLKKHFSKLGFSFGETVALIGGSRTVGPHVDPNDSESARERNCTSKPEVFDFEYFHNLYTLRWEEDTEAAKRAKNKQGSSFWGASSGGKQGAKPPGKVYKGTYRADDEYKNPYETEEMTKQRIQVVSMQPLDLTLLDDGILRGWVQKLEENEVKFYDLHAKACDVVFGMGWQHVQNEKMCS